MIKIAALLLISGLFIMLLMNEFRNAPLAEEQEDGSIRYVDEQES